MPQLIYRFGSQLGYGLILVGAVLLILIEPATFYDGWAIFRVVTVPLALLVFGYAWWYRQYFSAVMWSKWKPWGMALVTYVLLLFMSLPGALALNAITGFGKTITYAGPIRHKWIGTTGGKLSFPQYTIVITDRASGKDVHLHCSSSEYQSWSEGDVVSQTYSSGGLRIPYRWRQAIFDPQFSIFN